MGEGSLEGTSSGRGIASRAGAAGPEASSGAGVAAVSGVVFESGIISNLVGQHNWSKASSLLGHSARNRSNPSGQLLYSPIKMLLADELEALIQPTLRRLKLELAKTSRSLS